MFFNNDLSYIERNYGCVAEYNRCMEEREQEEAETEFNNQQYYAKNKAKMDEAAKDPNVERMFFSDDCIGCSHYTSIGPTHGNDWDVDDVEHGICDAPNLNWRGGCQYKQVRVHATNKMLEACKEVCYQCAPEHIPCSTCPVSKARTRYEEELKEYD